MTTLTKTIYLRSVTQSFLQISNFSGITSNWEKNQRRVHDSFAPCGIKTYNQVWINKSESKDWGKVSFMQPKHWKPCHLKRDESFSYTIFYRSNAFQQNNNIIVQDGYKVHSILNYKTFYLTDLNNTISNSGLQGIRSLMIFSH